jgi:hypothetical protein
MADSILSITVRDSDHPCAPYQATNDHFVAQIYHCDHKPLHWKGLDGTKVPLEAVVPDGPQIHGQFPVPPGIYLVRAEATCKNVITDWAWVQVCCNQTVCVNLVASPVVHCINRMIYSLRHGTAGVQNVPVWETWPTEALRAAVELRNLVQVLPKEPGPGLPAPAIVDDIEGM